MIPRDNVSARVLLASSCSGLLAGMHGTHNPLSLSVPSYHVRLFSIAPAGTLAGSAPGCGRTCNCPNVHSCLSGVAKSNCCWNTLTCGYFPCDVGKTCCPLTGGGPAEHHHRHLLQSPPPFNNTVVCVNLETDTANCGACGWKCSAGESCVAGACVGLPDLCAGVDCNGANGNCDHSTGACVHHWLHWGPL